MRGESIMRAVAAFDGLFNKLLIWHLHEAAAIRPSSCCLRWVPTSNTGACVMLCSLLLFTHDSYIGACAYTHSPPQSISHTPSTSTAT